MQRLAQGDLSAHVLKILPNGCSQVTNCFLLMAIKFGEVVTENDRIFQPESNECMPGGFAHTFDPAALLADQHRDDLIRVGKGKFRDSSGGGVSGTTGRRIRLMCDEMQETWERCFR